jgi:hypothetical protein
MVKLLRQGKPMASAGALLEPLMGVGMFCHFGPILRGTLIAEVDWGDCSSLRRAAIDGASDLAGQAAGGLRTRC